MECIERNFDNNVNTRFEMAIGFALIAFALLCAVSATTTETTTYSQSISLPNKGINEDSSVGVETFPSIGGSSVGVETFPSTVDYCTDKYYEVSLSEENVATAEKEETIAKEKSLPDSNTVIYRYGSQLYPTEKDVLYNSGLSFTTNPPKHGDYCYTTIEAVNATGLLIAIYDGNGHVTVYSTCYTTKEWHELGSNCVCTQVLQAITIYVP